MLNSGMDIEDFEDTEKRVRLTVSAEAFYAENMSNLFLTEIVQREFEDFNMVQQQAFATFNFEYPVITLSDEKIKAIRNYLCELLNRWNEMAVGEILELTFTV